MGGRRLCQCESVKEPKSKELLADARRLAENANAQATHNTGVRFVSVGRRRSLVRMSIQDVDLMLFRCTEIACLAFDGCGERWRGVGSGSGGLEWVVENAGPTNLIHLVSNLAYYVSKVSNPWISTLLHHNDPAIPATSDIVACPLCPSFRCRLYWARGLTQSRDFRVFCRGKKVYNIAGVGAGAQDIYDQSSPHSHIAKGSDLSRRSSQPCLPSRSTSTPYSKPWAKSTRPPLPPFA